MRAVDLLKVRKREIEALQRLNKAFGVEKPLFVYICTALNTLREYMLYEDVALWLKEDNYLKLVCNAPIFWKDIMVNIKFVKHKSPIF